MKALDRSNLKVLLNIEKEPYMQMKLENIKLSMISIFRGKKAILAGIKCLGHLITHKNSASATNIADELDFIIEREDKAFTALS